MKAFSLNHALIILLSGLLFFSCSQPEMVIVDEGPTTTPEDTSESPGEPPREFRKLVIGEYSNINTLDPLFADNAGSMRAVQLLYEGLVRFDVNGEIVPAIAKSWEVSDDSSTYRFTLRPDIYYQDSEVFSAGAGRKVQAGDVKFVIERTARNSVPPEAAHLFMSINGFEPYYLEQRNLYNPADRELQEVGGVQTPNDTTVVFELVEKDEQFLEKLATPLAVIYPQEAVNNSPEGFSPVGTGPFRFSQKNNDTYIFSRYDDYYGASEIEINRVDIRSITDESELFKSFAAGEIQLLPQLGPEIIQAVVDEGGSLSPSYAEKYRLDVNSGQTKYVLRYNTSSELPESVANLIAGLAYSGSGVLSMELPEPFIEINSAIDSSVSSTEYTRPVFATYSEDPFIQFFYKSLREVISSEGLEFQMVKIRTPSQNTGLFFTVEYPILNVRSDLQEPELGSYSIRHLSLRQTELNNLSFNKYPWWINLRSIELPQTTTRK